MLSLSFSLFSSSGSLKSSSNTPHITLSEFNLEAICAQSVTGFKKIIFSLVTLHRSTYNLLEEEFNIFWIFFYENWAVRIQVTIFFADVFAVDD